jgi:hypothetical protein
MAVPALRPSGRQLEELAAVCGLGASKLGLIRRQIADHSPTISRRKIQEAITTVVSATESRHLSRFLLAAAVTIRRQGIDIKNFVEGVSIIVRSRHDRDTRFVGWDECRSEVMLLLELPSVRLAAKAFDISYDFERVLTEARLITSIRPVFGLEDDDTTIVGSTVVQTLRLEYASQQGDHTNLSIALDLDDVRQLSETCDRALRKAQASVDLIQGKCAIEAIIIGEKDK